MRKRNFYILSVLSSLAAAPAMADWQYPGVYVGDGWYEDDGSRFVISARGGASFGMADIKNDIGATTAGYYVSESGDGITTEGQWLLRGQPAGWSYAGYAELGKLPAAKDFESFSFAAGASIGWTIPNRPQWRIEAGWDHIAESDYNSSPMFQGEMELIGGDVGNIVAEITSASVHSKITTDVISVMAFYDFFDGIQKPSRDVIPYVGFGIGYADSKTILNLADPYGDISFQAEFDDYGEVVEMNGIPMIDPFYQSEQNSSNVAGLLALGVSYGITETMFLDFGARVMYLPKVKWELANADDTKHREFFSAENLIYANIMLGVRFEF